MRMLLGLALFLVLLWFLLPREPVDMSNRFDPSTIGPDPETWLAEQEARFNDITPGVEKQILWAKAPGEKTETVIVYVHGFSATSQEIRPVPDLVAEALGANLLMTRLTGHGRSGEALAGAVAGDWVRDMDEALAVARLIGDRVLVIGTSTGGALAAALLAEGRQMDGIAMVSPNFKLKNSLAFVLTLPAARYWGPMVFGQERSFTTHNDGHAKFWTWKYPSVATIPLGALTKAAGAANYGSVTTPAMFIYAEADDVVDSTKTTEISETWGGPTTTLLVTPGPQDDPSKHVIAGDIMSPSQTEKVTNALIEWAKGLE